MSSSYLFTSESVSEGHPDKICDQISDGILDSCLLQDPESRVACETLVKTGLVVIAGEISSRAQVPYAQIARKIIAQIGYTHSHLGFDAYGCGIMVAIEEQSSDIALGVDEVEGREQGAGDQGMMFGYACHETPEAMPASLFYAHKVLEKLAEARKLSHVSWLRPDAKSQVTVSYENGTLQEIPTLVLSTQHDPQVSQKEIQEFVIESIIKKVIPSNLLKNTRYLINPTGRFVVGGPQGDAGLTGRKIIVDTYGGHGAHGGGAFSGKDPSKVDRSAAYMARYVAKHLVKAQIAEKCLVQLAYAIGVAEPVSVHVHTYGTSAYSTQDLAKAVRQIFPLTPKGIIETLNLKRPIYESTARYGHFGHSEYPWEVCDRLEAVRERLPEKPL